MALAFSTTPGEESEEEELKDRARGWEGVVRGGIGEMDEALAQVMVRGQERRAEELGEEERA